MNLSTRKLSILAFLLAVSILLSLIEASIPIAWIFPGFKIGLANIISLYVLYAFGLKEMVLISYVRITLSSLLTGSFLAVSFFISFCGTTLAIAAMAAAYASGWFSIYGVSLAGAAAHMTGQVLFVSFLYQSFVFQFLLPFLLAFSALSGLLTAWISQIMLRRLRL